MTGLNDQWALDELDKVIEQTVLPTNSYVGGAVVVFTSKSSTAAPDAEVMKQAQVLEKILDRVLPDWRTETELWKTNRWTRHREAAIRPKEELLRQGKIQNSLANYALRISAADLQPWVWGGAGSLWPSGHFRSAVEDAANEENAETQNKIGRREPSETELFQEVFSEKPPAAGKACLRRTVSDGSETYESVQHGAIALAERIYAGIRNPFTRDDPRNIEEQIALEHLAALSVLARWLDESTVEVA